MSQTNVNPSEFEKAFIAGTLQTIERTFEGPQADIPYMLAPREMQLHDLTGMVEKQLPQPFRTKAKVELLSAQSFIDYYNRFADERSTIFVNTKNASFVAVFDYHSKEAGPGWAEHRAAYSCPQTKEWGAWIENDNKKMNQEDFALFIEDNLKEIIEPNGAQMLEIASSLKASSSVDFRQSTRLDNGQVQFTYHQTINGQAGVAGTLEIPEKIKLVIKPFLSGASYQIEARFRYRINAGGLSMWYTLIRPHLCTENALEEIVAKFREEMKAGQLVEGLEPKQ